MQTNLNHMERYIGKWVKTEVANLDGEKPIGVVGYVETVHADRTVTIHIHRVLEPKSNYRLLLGGTRIKVSWRNVLLYENVLEIHEDDIRTIIDLSLVLKDKLMFMEYSDLLNMHVRRSSLNIPLPSSHS